MMGARTAVLVAVRSGKTDSEELTEYLDELAFLAQTLDIAVSERFIQRLIYPDMRTFVGKGKLEEIKNFIHTRGIHCMIFEEDLSPSQLRNLERILNPKSQAFNVRIYDRSLLILEIFLHRARTAQARTQVELAMNQYLLPRLTRMWTHLERQRGGTGTRGGSGEKELETDRRNISAHISVLKRKLIKIDRQSTTRRKARQHITRVSLVGYTNTGKSTLMNLFTKAGVVVENKLFATVDTVVRKVVLEGIPFLLSDTVGFIRKLPAHLVESFKSTLDEVREADVLLHVVDVSHPFHIHHLETVGKMLIDIGAEGIPTILVLNKVDMLQKRDDSVDIAALKNNYTRYGFADVVFVSAVKKENIPELKKSLLYAVQKKHMTLYPQTQDSGKSNE